MASAARMTALAALALAGCSAAPQAVADGTRGCTQSWLALAGRITDADDLLDAAAETRLVNKLSALEADSGHQLVIVTVPDLAGQTIEKYTRCLANHWAIGRKGMNDGIVLLVVRTAGQLRIEVGRGLEAALTDDEAKLIIERSIIPAFRSKDYAGGLAAGVDAIANEVS